MNSPRAILVTRLRFLGDIILSTPLLDALRANFPGARLEYLGCPPHVDVLERHPYVDRIHRLPADASAVAMLQMARTLRARRFDVAIDLFGNPRSAFLVACTGAPIRVGPQRGVRSWLYTHRRGRPAGDRSAVRHHLDKIVPLRGQEIEPSRPRLFVGEEERARLQTKLAFPHEARMRVVNPGATWATKAWPTSRWTQLIDWMTADSAQPVFVLEPPGQPGLAAQVCQGTKARALPALGLREVLALLTHTALYVGNDGGILHAAVALGVPTLGLFGPTEPDIWFPYADFGPYRVLHRCDPEVPGAVGEAVSRLRSLEVESVIEALAEVAEAAGTRTDA